MQTPDFSRSRIDAMINLNDPLAVLATRLPWTQLEAALAVKFERRARDGQVFESSDDSRRPGLLPGGRQLCS
uniref:Uncharacterized protein n=1 Tax=mine drainage metagenome TaxID=410659 RepID=E6PSA9_9ZZZZ